MTSTSPTCIFCDNVLGQETKPEHILLSALGGRKTTKRAICSKHNEDFGGSIDNALAKQVSFLRNQLQLESGTRKPPPGLGRAKAGKETVEIKSDGTPKLIAKPFAIKDLGSGQFQVSLTVNTAEEIETYLPHIAAQLGLTTEQARAQFAKGHATVTSRRAGQIHRPTPLGGELECRSIVKSCLVLWATKVGNGDVKSEAYRSAREYVLTGGKFSTPLDSRPLPFLDKLKERYGEFFNLIYIRSDDVGRVIAHFALYNIISWQVVLTERGGAPNQKIALASNPLDPSIWSDTVADKFDLEMGWLEAPDFDVPRTQGRLAAALEKSQKDGMDREFKRIVDEVCLKHGLDTGKPIADPELSVRLQAEVWRRYAHHVLGIPYEEAITGAELLARTVIGKKSKP